MRRNLRLDWRALALLGALLSIIIDWPGLVYAMPTILPPVNNAAPLDMLNSMTSDETLRFFPGDYLAQQKENKMPNEFSKGNLKIFLIQSSETSPTTQKDAKQTVAAMETKELQRQPQQPQRQTTTFEKQQVNENSNSISDKQQINDNSHQQQQQQQQQEKQYEQLELTAIHHLATANEQQNSQDKTEVEAASLKEASLSNTHTKNSIINTISLINKSTTSLQPTITTSKTTKTIKTTPATTTESSAKIQSTLMTPSFNSETDILDESLLSHFKLSSSNHLAILSRTERSIRSHSASSSSVVSPAAAVVNESSPLSGITSRNISSKRTSRASSLGRGSSLVRRSSDVSVLKSKRLNNSRNLHHKNNLDRNERSTVSHLSGPSRKIQLYIKNRFLQLMPDGTVNGTQDEQCDYI